MIKAREENVPAFRIFANRTFEGIAALKPKNREELLTIKGLGLKKFEKYGKEILEIVGGDGLPTELLRRSPPDNDGEDAKQSLPRLTPDNGDKRKPYSVSKYLDLLNQELREKRARIQGEISSLDIRENYLFFSLKDKDDESVLNCFMWKYDYQLSGILLEPGLEIIIEGFPEVYKPSGRLTFRVLVAELVGEGALKKAYQESKKKLEDEGLFALERKKPIPKFPQKIGLITSESGAVIHDFLNNLGQYGYQIKFISSRVEGQVAVRDLLSAIDYFKEKVLDVLVIIRGGGSLESLQAFNNEILVRKIANFNKPVICGIGHEKDVPLASLAADLMVSTPTAAAMTLNKSWDKALDNIRVFERDIIYKYQKVLVNQKHQLELMAQELRQKSDFIFKRFEAFKHQLMNKLVELDYHLKNARKKLNESLNMILVKFEEELDRVKDYLERTEKRLKVFDPREQLKLGYSIVSIKGRILKSIKQVSQGEGVDIKVADGKIKSRVEQIINNK